MRQRRLWTPQEDKVLKYLREQQKIKKWSTIAKMMEEDYSMANRTGKQCRQRYFNHLDSEIRHEEWSQQEQRILWEMHSQYGNRWTLMTSRIKGRSENCIKNHFYSKLRKAVRRLNKLIIDRFKTQYKQIKTSLLYKILQSAEDKFRPGKSSNIQSMDLATSIKNRLFLYQTQQLQKAKQLQVAKALILDINTLDERFKNQERYMKNTSGFLDPRSYRRMDHSFDSQDNFSVYSSTSYNSSFQPSQDEQEDNLSHQGKQKSNRNTKLLNKLSLQEKPSNSKMLGQHIPNLNFSWAQQSLPTPNNETRKQDHHLLGGQLHQSLTLRPSKSQKTFSFQNVDDKVSDIEPTRNTRNGQHQKCISDIAKYQDSQDQWDLLDNNFLYPKSNRQDELCSNFFEEPRYGEFQIVVNSPKVPSEDDRGIINFEKMDEQEL